MLRDDFSSLNKHYNQNYYSNFVIVPVVPLPTYKLQDNSFHHSDALSDLEDTTKILCRFSNDEKLVSYLF